MKRSARDVYLRVTHVKLSHSCRGLASTSSVNNTVKTFSQQSKVPRLPIPSLAESTSKYLASFEPFHPKGSDQYNNLNQIVQDFCKPDGLGTTLQSRLIEYEKTQPNSWLEEIWLKYAYLMWRYPSMINVNWWCQFRDHPGQPPELLSKPPPKGVLSAFQIQRAAGLIQNTLTFKESIDNQTLSIDSTKAKDGSRTPMCMNQYKNQFGATRMPGAPIDEILTQYPATGKHIIVMCRDQMYRVDVYTASGERVPVKELMRQLFVVGQQSLDDSSQPPIGVLTGGDRDVWFKAYTQLVETSPQNKQNFETIKQALFVLCLDDYSTSQNLDASHHQIFHGMDAHNRYFDKAIEIVVANSGRAGVNGEHTPADAVIPGRFMDFILSNEPAADPANVSSAALPPIQKLEWQTTPSVMQAIESAGKICKELIDNTSSVLLHYDIYGGRYIKEVAKTAPDSFVQMALQLAWRRMHQDPTAVYESASTRSFLHGRTETIRSLSKESWQFACNFDNDDVLYADKRRDFATAIATHRKYQKDASTGNGIDRHFLGLRAMMDASEQSSSPPFFSDPAFALTSKYRLSSSNMSPGDWFYGGFGPVYEDGYGINYAIGNDGIKFSISGNLKCRETRVREFRSTLERTLTDMMILFPKRTEVWGFGWQRAHARERQDQIYLAMMKNLSDQYIEKKDVLKEKYSGAKPNKKEK
ncbi:hypothetical protein SmJEL517_g02819 [Synchytrium microbalum]|uniref:Choline/carnitine acyltransferase domain-containing protein n=1 Tax=Synchytrium microbalum TaxID=1806994 RepID=A0A507CAL9_9FUNG|nr:uncharacterized protein SmJEL517_g02819 [Synchytrium microbalum]TPX34563.1 hypothetical protein SmJEL517_g02819 [Synchytrium microbalum]